MKHTYDNDVNFSLKLILTSYLIYLTIDTTDGNGN